MRFVLNLIGSKDDESKKIAESDSYQDISLAMSRFEQNPENRVNYKIEPYHTIHGWTESDNNGTRKQIIDFGDYHWFYEITDNDGRLNKES